MPMPSASPRPPNPNPRAPVRLRARRAFPADRRVAVGTAAADGAALLAKDALQEGTKKDLVSVAQYYSSKLVSYVRKARRHLWPVARAVLPPRRVGAM